MADTRDRHALTQSQQRLVIDRLGRQGEGIADVASGAIKIAFAVPGDTIEASIDRDHGEIASVLEPSSDRVAPFCPWFTRCGGCATQSTALALQWRWKRELVVAALANAGIEAPVMPCIDAHGAGRRRATFHGRRAADKSVHVGFMAARTHDLVAIDQCPLFAPELSQALDAARALAPILAATDKPFDIAVTATDSGLDLDVRGTGPLDDGARRALIAIAERQSLARLSNHGVPIITFRAPSLRVGNVAIDIPPGAFLQATAAGEDALAGLVLDAVGDASRVVDLYCGIGTFALRLAKRADVHAVEAQAPALDALLVAARRVPDLRSVSGEKRDLVRRPLTVAELAAFDAVVFDPPRVGAAEQTGELARSTVPLVVGVSCNPQTFARDATMLIDGGYRLERVTPVDQFRHSAHVELVGVFRRAARKRKRSLLG